MKKLIYPLFVLCAVCMLCSCEIDDDCLEDDIRRKFEQERRNPTDKDQTDKEANLIIPTLSNLNANPKA